MISLIQDLKGYFVKGNKQLPLNKYTLFFMVFISFLHVFSCYHLGSFSYLFPICLLLRFFLLITNSKKNLTFLVMWIYFELSFFGYITLSIFFKDLNSNLDSLYIGELCLTSFLIFQLFSLASTKTKLNNIPELNVESISKYIIIPLLILIPFVFTFISYKLNIIAMGVERPVLPYKIEHILNLSRSVVFPFFFTLFIGRTLYGESRSKKNVLIYFCIFNLWLLLETVLRGSKGFILITNFPIILLLIHHNSVRFLKKAAIFLIVITPIIYVTGKAIRNSNIHKTTFTKELKSSYHGIGNQLVEIYQRNFYDAEIIYKFSPYVDGKEKSFLLKRFQEQKGSINFHTNVLDKMKKQKGHSSGTTLIGDGYLMLGKLGVILSVFALILLTTFNDYIIRPFFKKESGVYCFFIFWIYTLTFWSDGFWSYFMYRSPLTTMIFPCLVVFAILLNKYPLKIFPRKRIF
ncbi:hypothetical protein [Halobacteriovorax sp. HLS]|uniref:hypothetical protein n=1 Tax=Halobacteriovorax sp. HLS TaxID=2234000 RepID=UPI000FDBF0D4|nr:hypothetical protein [Halobacteriovorax sp. HLS]